MAYLKYYTDERARWPVLQAANRIGQPEAELGIRRICRQFNVRLKHITLRFTRGHRTSNAGKYSITINMDYCNWLTIAHEVAHTYHANKYKRDENWHGKTHARIVDRFAAWILAQGWHLGTLAHEVALAEVTDAQQAQARALVAAMPIPIDARIERRAAQVVRLTRKIKTLTTRRASALRSLNALKRAQAKAQAQEDTFNRKAEAEERDAKKEDGI